jgi:hypothetical protein
MAGINFKLMEVLRHPEKVGDPCCRAFTLRKLSVMGTEKQSKADSTIISHPRSAF